MNRPNCPRCNFELLKPNPQESILSVCPRCRWSGSLVVDVAKLYLEEKLSEQPEESEAEAQEKTAAHHSNGLLF